MFGQRARVFVAGVVAVTAFAVAGVALAGSGSVSARWAHFARGPALTPPGLQTWLARHHVHQGTPAASSFFRDPSAPTVAAGSNPVLAAVDPSTQTVYVSNGNDNNLSVIDGSTCNATVASGCGQDAPTVAAGPGPVYAVLDRSRHTLYVTDVASNTVAMIDTAACNAQNDSGCGASPAMITVGNSPDGLSLDKSTHTLYVANYGDNTISIIDTATCNVTDSAGCAAAPTIAVGGGPAIPAVNADTHTLYVPNSADNTLSVIDISACNAETESGCSQAPATMTVGPNPFQAIVDQATDTVYDIVGPEGEQTNLGSVQVINGASCNGHVTSGCDRIAAQVTVGSIPIAIFEDASTRNIFVSNEEDSSISIISGAGCNATHLSGCKQGSLTLSVGHNPGAQIDVNPATHTLYVPSQNDNDVSVLDTRACTATHQQGCRVAAPLTTVGTGPQGIAANPATNTIYVGNRTDSNLSVVDGNTCNATNRSGCGHAWPTVATGDGPQAVAVDPKTDTVYSANVGVGFSGGDTVSVVDGSTCNSHTTSGCGKAPATVTVGNIPVALAVDEATDTVYVANVADNTVSVIDGDACNGANHSGCAAVATIAVGQAPQSIAVDEATKTVYVLNGVDGTVSMIDAATCNGSDHAGCNQAALTFASGSPTAVAVEQATDTLYVANFFQSISVIDSTTCNAHNQSGCTPVAAIDTPDFVNGLGVDQRTGGLFVDLNFYGSQVWAFDGSRCNAQTATGCDQAPQEIPVGGWPGPLASNPGTGTIYVADNVDGQASLFGYANGVAFP
jgi:YVTN family beta-propeller protein